MPKPSDEPISISARPSVWLEIGRDLGGSKRTMTRLIEVIDNGHDGTEEQIGRWSLQIVRLAMDAQYRLDEARKLWADLIEHQAAELPDEATGGDR